MACPTCDGTMQALGCRVTDRNFFWCPRCGTMKTCQEDTPVVPALVNFCRGYEKTLVGECAEHDYQFNAHGIRDAINVPANRPKH